MPIAVNTNIVTVHYTLSNMLINSEQGLQIQNRGYKYFKLR